MTTAFHLSHRLPSIGPDLPSLRHPEITSLVTRRRRFPNHDFEFDKGFLPFAFWVVVGGGLTTIVCVNEISSFFAPAEEEHALDDVVVVVVVVGVR